jgi:drug/metabolite transporter (DMT)-like permease
MNGMWLPLSLVTAFALATSDALTKKFFGDLHAYEMGLARLFFSLPFLASAFFFIPPISPDQTFWICMATGLPLESAAFYCYMKALKSSPLSLSMPFLAFSPMFMVVTGWIVLGERVGMTGCLGIFLIVAGSYLLNLSHAARGPIAPFRAIIKEPGSRYMLLAAFIYSFTSVIGKKAIEHSSPLFYAAVYFTLFSFIMLGLYPLFPGTRIKKIFSRPGRGAAIGISYAVMVFCHTTAISMVQAAYMISIKRLSLIFGVMYGAVIFKEEKIRERMLGACTMLAGAVVITLFG